jgi:hypothetical protein
MFRPLRGLLACFLALCSFQQSLHADLLVTPQPFRIDDEFDLLRQNEVVAMGVPLDEASNVLSTSQLMILAPDGNEVPSQWRVARRWRSTPGNAAAPIQWALALFPVDLAPGQMKQYRLGKRTASDLPAPPLPAKPVDVAVEGTALTIETGVARFEFATNVHSGFGNVYLDLDGDGVYGSTPDELVLAGAKNLGPVLIDRFDGIYLGAGDTAPKYVIEEQGPVRAVIRVDALHQPFGTGTIGRDYLKFTTRYYFTAGSSAVRVEHSIQNSYLTQPLGAITIGRYLHHSRLKATDPVRVRFGGDDGNPATLPISVPAPLEVVQFQDSHGGNNWNTPGTTFPGWRVFAGTPNVVRPESFPATPPIKSGPRAAGWMDVESGTRGMFVSLRYPWQNYPYAMRALYDGTVVVDMLPSEFAGEHWLDDAQRKTWDLVYQFHGPVFDPALASAVHQRPLRPRVNLSYLRGTSGWGDFGDIRKPALTEEAMIAEGKKQLSIFQGTLESKGSYGWQNFGEYTWAKSTHATGSPRNRLTWFDRFMICGGYAWFERAETFALHSMDLRKYHIDGFKYENHPGCILSEGIPGWPSTNMLGRDQIPASLAPYNSQIPLYGHGWNGYDGEHMTVDDLYEYYLLTGSYNALDSMRKIGEGILSWKVIAQDKSISSSRFKGWVMRSLLQIHGVVGDPRLMDRARDLLISSDNFRGKSPSPETGKTYRYLTRHVYGGGTHGMDEEYDMPWQIAVAVYGFAGYYRETGDMMARDMLIDIAAYVTQYCVVAGIVVDALECDNHNVINPKVKNDGVNAWITSAMAVAYRYSGYQPLHVLGKKIYDDNETHFLTTGDNYHWYHTAAKYFDNDG